VRQESLPWPLIKCSRQPQITVELGYRDTEEVASRGFGWFSTHRAYRSGMRIRDALHGCSNPRKDFRAIEVPSPRCLPNAFVTVAKHRQSILCVWMRVVLYLLLLLAVLGAADTLYYHEWRAKLPALGPQARSELELHAFRDFIYAILFSTLPWIAWEGIWALVLAVLLLVEIILTLWDFVVEDWVRESLGGLYAGERIMHGLMGIIFGGMLAYFVPTLRYWSGRPVQLAISPVAVVPAVRWAMLAMGIGVLISGLRDLYAAFEMPGSAWPCKR